MFIIEIFVLCGRNDAEGVTALRSCYRSTAQYEKIPETGWLILFRGVAYTLNPSVASTAVTVVRMRFIHTDHLFFVLSVMFSSFHDSILRSALCDACVAEHLEPLNKGRL